MARGPKNPPFVHVVAKVEVSRAFVCVCTSRLHSAGMWVAEGATFSVPYMI